MGQAAFLQVPTREVNTSQGEVRLPILYSDASVLFAFFAAEHGRAEAKVEGPGVVPLRLPGDRALVLVAFLEYRETSIGPYNEVGTAIAVLPRGEARRELALDLLRPASRRKLGLHVIDLPVSTPTAHAAGRELWGYPKFVTELPMSFGEHSFRGVVCEPGSGEPMVTLEGGMGLARVPVPAMDLVLYSHLGGALLRTRIDVQAPMVLSPGSGFQLRVGPSGHRMAQNLRELGLDGARPLLVQSARMFQSRLNGGEPVPVARNA